MPRFSIRYPYFIIVVCLVTGVLGITSLVRMPVDLFPTVRIPVVVVATFYSGMPAEDVETSITSRFERFFTLGSGIEHIESRSLPGTSLIRVYFQPGTDPDSAVTSISNLAMANLRRLPPGTLPPVVLKFDASSLPVCLVTLKAPSLTEAQLRDIGQFNVRNQVAGVKGASVPQPFGGKYRQIMVYVDPLKLEANQLSVMDVVRAVNSSNLILPAGDVKIGPLDYNIFTNSQLETVNEINAIPLKSVKGSWVTVADVGHAEDGSQIQTNVVRIDGQPSVYIPIMKQGGDSNTIEIVDGVKRVTGRLLDVPKELVTKVVFDQSVFVKKAIENLLHEGAIGLVLTGIMILVFLGSVRATVGVFFSIPLATLATFIALALTGNTVNSMILGGLALSFSRLIDNSVVVLENIYRHLEKSNLLDFQDVDAARGGAGNPVVAAELGGTEVALPVLAATITTSIVFLPVIFLYGVSKYLFTALALAVVLALFVSYVVAMTVVPLYAAHFVRSEHGSAGWGQRFNSRFNRVFGWFLGFYERGVKGAMKTPRFSLAFMLFLCFSAFLLLPLLGFSYFPRTDAGQFVVSMKAPTGTRIENTSESVKKVEEIIRLTVPGDELDITVSNIGTTPDFSAIYSGNTASHTAFVQASLKEGHKIGSYEYMERVRATMKEEMPDITAYFQSGGLVDAVLNMGLPAPIDVQVSGSNLEAVSKVVSEISMKARSIEGVSDVFIPQDLDAPAYKLETDRIQASEMGLNQKEIIYNVITALTSNGMVAPSYWVDPKSGNDYMLTVQYPEKGEGSIQSLNDLLSIPVRGENSGQPTRLAMVAKVRPMKVSTVVSHYQLRRVVDVYVATRKEDLSRAAAGLERTIGALSLPEGVTVNFRGSVGAMRESFKSFGLGLLLSVLLVYLVLVAQFKSFMEPLLILLAIPPGIAGALITLLLTGTTLNVMSLMGIVMLVGISVSNSILILEFTNRLREEGMGLDEAVVLACRVRLRPVLMTSLATIFGLIPMALALGAGSEAYASLARVIIGGLITSVAFTVFIVPVAYFLFYRIEGVIDAGDAGNGAIVEN